MFKMAVFSSEVLETQPYPITNLGYVPIYHAVILSRNTTLVKHPIVSLRHKNTIFYILEVSATRFYA